VIGVEVLSRNEELLEAYLAGRRLSSGTRENYRDAVRCFTRLLGAPLEEAGRPEFEEWYRRASSRGLASSTIDIYVCRLRKILEYALMRRGLSRRDALATSAAALEGVPITDLRRESRRRGPGREKIVTHEELDALLETARHPRARALIAVLYESGCRKGEVLSLRIRDVAIGDGYAEIHVLGKTGERTIPLIRSVKALTAWLEAHPDPRPGVSLFCTVVSGEVRRMARGSPNHLLKDLCFRAGLRHVHPHMLRHTRLTELARRGIGEYQLKSFAGWTPDSKMAARYIHLSGRDHIPAILKADAAHAEEAEG